MILIDKSNNQITEDFTSKDLHTLTGNVVYKLDIRVINSLQKIKSFFNTNVKIIETFFEKNDENRYKKIRFKFTGAGAKKAQKELIEGLLNKSGDFYQIFVNSDLKGICVDKNYIEIDTGKVEKIEIITPIEPYKIEENERT